MENMEKFIEKATKKLTATSMITQLLTIQIKTLK